MTDFVGNVNPGRLLRSTWFLIPALIAIIAVSGVTAKPVLGLGNARVLHDVARKRLLAYRSERARAVSFARDDGLVRLADTLREIQGVIPSETSPLVLHSLVQIVARRRGLALESVEITPPRETDFEVILDRVIVTAAEVRGAGTLEALSGILVDLSAAGHPCALSAFSLARRDPSDAVFEIRATLGFWQRAPLLLPKDPSPQGGQ